MNEDINQECKVVAFEYFQQNISSWENWHIDHSATINQILGIYKKQLSEEKDNILKQINIGFNEQFETNLNNYVTEFNKLSKQYLDVVDNYDIDLSNEISKYIFAYNDYIEKQTILNSIQGPPVIDNNVLENIKIVLKFTFAINFTVAIVFDLKNDQTRGYPNKSGIQRCV